MKGEIMAQKITCPVCFTKMNEVGHDLVCPECGYKYCEGRKPYTYDDHNHNDYQSYNQKTTYSTGKTTTTGTYGQGVTKATDAYLQSGAYSQKNNYTQSQSSTYAQKTTYTQPQASTYTQKTTYTQPQSGTYSQKSTYTQPQASTYAQKTTYSQPQRTATGNRRKPSAGKFVIIIVLFYFLIVACAGLIALFSEGFFNNGKTGFFEKFDEYFSGTNSKEPAAVPVKEVIYESPSAEEILSGFQRKETPDSILQELLVHVTSHKIDEITQEDCDQFLDIEFYEGDNGIDVYYELDNGDADGFSTEYTSVDTSEFKIFRYLQGLHADETIDLHFQPGDLGGMKDLYYLTCSNTLEELLEIVDPMQISALSIFADGVYSLHGIDEFSELYYLKVHANTIMNAEELVSLKRLQYLDIMTNGLMGFSFLKSMTSLEYLFLTSPFITDISFLEGLPHLDSLQIWSDSSLLTDISPIKNCTELTALDLSYNTHINDYSPLGSLSELETLYLDGTNVRDLSFAKSLKNLSAIAVTESNVTDLTPLEDLPLLEYVYYSAGSIKNFGNLDSSILIQE